MKTKLDPRCSVLAAILVAFTQLSILTPQPASAQSPLPDDFNPGANDWVTSLVVQADGKIVVGGAFTTLGGQPRTNIARLNADGTLVSGFNPGTGAVADPTVYSLALQADGKILVGGVFTTLGGQTRNYIGRLNANGTLDTAFNPGANARVDSLAVQADGRILVGGDFTRLGGQPRNYIGRLYADGTLDSGFNPGANGTVFSPAVQADGKILVGGWFTTLGGQTRNHIARLNANGTLDTPFNPGANDTVYSLAMQADGKILVGGGFTTLGGQTRNYIGRLKEDGILDTGFNPGASYRVPSLAVQADGKILVSGVFTNLGGQTRNYIGRLNADGTLDSGFNPGANNWVLSLAVQADGKILVGGVFTNLGGQTRNYLGRLNNTGPATQSLTFDGSTITWLRGGTSPEVWRTTFDLSTDGLTWTTLGAGTRRAGGWQLALAASPPSGVIRGRGYITGGAYNGSGWFVESQLQFTNAPTIVEDPQSATNISGTTATFTVNATGRPPLAYQWSKDGVALVDGGNLSGARSNVLTLANVQWADAGQYTVVVTNVAGAVTSQVASLTVLVPPQFLTQPQSQTVQAAGNVVFSVTATGTPPLNYQWRNDGVNISGATGATLTLNSVGASASGGYSVVVWNAYGFVVSATAHLSVLTDGANGSQPTQLSEPLGPAMGPSQDSLVLVTHGWQPREWNLEEPPTSRPQWMTDLCVALQSKVPANWVVWPYDWMHTAWKWTPDAALSDARFIVGPWLGARLAAMQLSQLHLISHSAGAGLIEAAAKMVRAVSPSTIIHCTFLDPFTGAGVEGRSYYGQSADWADNYFVHDFMTDVAPTIVFLRRPGESEGPLDHAYNVDVAAAAPGALRLPTFFSGPNATAGSTPAIGSYSPSHDSPHQFYLSTVLGTAPVCPDAAGYGFAFSQEAGGWASRLTHPVHNDPPFALCGSPSPIQNAAPVVTGFTLSLESLPNATSASGVSLFSGGGASLSTAAANHGGIHPNDVGTPAWLAVGVTITNNVNFVQFDAGFTDTNAAEGLLTVYWNTNQIGMVDERVALAGLQTYRFVLPAAVSEGLYTLSFRLDVFTNATSIAVTNVATGFVGIAQPITLDILSMGSNNTPVVKLTAAPGYNYLMQSSTNLVEWTPTALLVNTNGTVLFADPPITNSSARFYRAVMP